MWTGEGRTPTDPGVGVTMGVSLCWPNGGFVVAVAVVVVVSVECTFFRAEEPPAVFSLLPRRFQSLAPSRVCFCCSFVFTRFKSFFFFLLSLVDSRTRFFSSFFVLLYVCVCSVFSFVYR